jgi:ATP-dependent DNA helicase RecQ
MLDLQPDLLAAPTALLQRFFGFKELRDHQRMVLQEVMQGHDCLAVIPTGSGKSFCYVLPALQSKGLTLVISPLIALIREQVLKFSQAGVACAALDSLQQSEEKQEVWQRIEDGSLALLFVSPERLSSKAFRDRIMQHRHIDLVAIDEAHCISQWGSHFRPEYRKVGEYLRDFGSIPKLALTATATSKVRQDIIKALALRTPKVILSGVLRENLHIKVLKSSSESSFLTSLLEGVQSTSGQGIIYATTRKKVDLISTMLRDAGIPAQAYHAGMNSVARAQAQRAFIHSECRVMVATNAFGLGIDKNDIRFVFHAGMPASLEQYIQEIGRAGRDGADAKCYLFYGGRDFYVQRFLIDTSYPEVDDLRKAYAELEKLLAGGRTADEEALINLLSNKFTWKRDNVVAIVRFLCRERLLTRDLPGNMAWDSGYREVTIRMEPQIREHLTQFFNDYPQRKVEHLHKLGKMHEFATSGAERMRIIQSYFND